MLAKRGISVYLTIDNNFAPCGAQVNENKQKTILKNQGKVSKTMSAKKIDAIKYKANDYRLDKKGKRTPSKFAFWVRANGTWSTAAESGDERAERFRGVFSADVAAFTLPDVLAACGLDVPDGVKTAAAAAGERIAAKALKIEKREKETVEKGRAAFLTAKAESAQKAWDRLEERVIERENAKEESETAESDGNETDESASAEIAAA